MNENIRIKTLRRVIADEFGGKQTAFAQQVRTHRSIVSEMLAGKRVMGEHLARSWEALLRKPNGFFDGLQAQYRGGWPFPFTLEEYLLLPESQRTSIEGRVLGMIEANRLK